MALYQVALLCILLVVESSVWWKEAHSLPSSSTFCAGKPNGVYANPLSCSSFWACWDNGAKGSLLLCPPNTLWNQPSLSCTHTPPSSALPSPSNSSIASPFTSPSSSPSNDSSASTSSPALNASLVTSIFNSSSASNSSMASFLPSCSMQSSHGGPHLPIWSWNGLLGCYGDGCLDAQKPSVRSQFDIGIPCLAAQELISMAKHSTQAWIPAPHQFLAGDLNLIGGKHWKIRFDSLEKEADSGLTLLKASITDYSPSQKIQDSWQGGPREAQFALEGPHTSPQGGCYYSISLESPDLGDIWEPFTRDLIKESNFEQREGGLGSLLSTQAMPGQGALFGRVHKKRRGKKRRAHNSVDTIKRCLKIIPWASLVATALCYASNAGGGSKSVALCSDIPTPDLISIATCLSSFMGISSELGL